MSTNTPSIPSVLPYIHEPTMRSVIQHPLSLTQDDSNFRKIDLDSSSPGDCHTPPLQVTGDSSFLRNSRTFDSLRSVTPDSELSPSTNRVDNWLDNCTKISSFNFPSGNNDMVENLSSIQHNVSSDISAHVADEVGADISSIQGPSNT